MRFACLFALLVAGCATSPPIASPWASDAQAFVAELKRTHPNPGHFTPIARIEHAAARVGRGAEPVAELAALAAMVGDGHTVLPILTLPFDGVPPGPQIKLIPIRLEWFDDGLFVVGADRRYASLLGNEVESIGGVPAGEALRRVMRLLPRATPRFAEEYAPEWILADLVLRHAGLTTGAGPIRLTVGGRDVEIEPVVATLRFDWLLTRTAGMTADWVAEREVLPVRGTGSATIGRDILYVRIDQLRDPPGTDWGKFVNSIKRQAGPMPNPRLIIDIRDCVGGDGTLAPQLVDWIAGDPRFKRPGSVVTLIGRRTHSAGIMLASALEQRTATKFIGQRTGDAPNLYGETSIFILPRSKLPVIHASRYWRTSHDADRRPWISPHVAAPFTHADFARGIDPALDIARNSK